MIRIDKRVEFLESMAPPEQPEQSAADKLEMLTQLQAKFNLPVPATTTKREIRHGAKLLKRCLTINDTREFETWVKLMHAQAAGAGDGDE